MNNDYMWQSHCGIIKNLKWYWQRATRGYADCDMWSIKSYIGEIMPPLLRKLKNGVGCPAGFYDNTEVNNECHKWHEIIEEIAQGFEAAKWIDEAKYLKVVKAEGRDGYEIKHDDKATENAVNKMNKGLKLFAEHFLSLWD